MNLGGIYKDLGNLDQALESTLKSVELKPDSSTAYMNLGIIYRDLGNLDQALAFTLKSLELKGDNPGAVNNLKVFIDELNISPANTKDVMQAYEILLNQTDVAHKKLRQYSEACDNHGASTSDPIISEDNEALKKLLPTGNFTNRLLLPPSKEVEQFFTRLRRNF